MSCPPTSVPERSSPMSKTRATVDLRGRHLLTLADYSPEELTYLLDLAVDLKAAKRDGREEQRLVGKEIVLIFEKDSTRTRCAFEVAAYDQGAHVTFIGPSGCTTRSSTAASARTLRAGSPSGQGYPSTTVSQTSGTRPRSSLTS